MPGGMPDPNDPASMQQFLNQVQQMFSGMTGDGPVNWDLAKQIALASLTTPPGGMPGMGAIGTFGGQLPMGFGIPTEEPAEDTTAEIPAEEAPTAPGDPAVTPLERHQVTENLRLADLWLEDATALPSGISMTEAWKRSEWINNTISIWQKLCDPVAGRMVAAMGDLVPEEMRDQLGPMSSMVAALGGALFGGQLGQALGSLAAEVLSTGDIGLPLGPAGTAALVPANITAYGEGLSLEPSEVLLYVALREAAHQRLFSHVPWLRAHVLGAVEAYAAGIKVNRDAIEEAMGNIDPANPESMQDLALEGIFSPDDTPEQKAALNRLETTLALIEGWVAHVVETGAGDRLPNIAALAETFRRRRAAGGPAEQTFGALVGLELRPRRLREATALWAALTEHRGISGRDSIWDHPDLLPTADDFADPQAYAQSQLDFGNIEDLFNSLPPAEEPGAATESAEDSGTDEQASASGEQASASSEQAGTSGEQPGNGESKPDSGTDESKPDDGETPKS
jgi:putative hydrolase